MQKSPRPYVVCLLLHPNQVIIQVNTWLDAIIYHDRDLHQYVHTAVNLIQSFNPLINKRINS